MAKRKPAPPSDSGTVPIPEPFACSAIIHGERVFAAQDMRHDEAVKYANRIGAVAIEGVWISKRDATKIAALLDRLEGGRALAAELVKATTTLEAIE